MFIRPKKFDPQIGVMLLNALSNGLVTWHHVCMLIDCSGRPAYTYGTIGSSPGNREVRAKVDTILEEKLGLKIGSGIQKVCEMQWNAYGRAIEEDALSKAIERTNNTEINELINKFKALSETKVISEAKTPTLKS